MLKVAITIARSLVQDVRTTSVFEGACEVGTIHIFFMVSFEMDKSCFNISCPSNLINSTEIPKGLILFNVASKARKNLS